jgi:hypothetical protein
MGVDDLDEGEDNLHGYYSLRRGAAPAPTLDERG